MIFLLPFGVTPTGVQGLFQLPAFCGGTSARNKPGPLHESLCSRLPSILLSYVPAHKV